METITISSKYQVVIPKKLRRKLNLRPGQKLRIRETKDGSLEIDTKSALDQYVGAIPGAWGKDPAAYIRKMRDEWDD
jgi:AbrB family looped-hinge helix DNA binding protein